MAIAFFLIWIISWLPIGIPLAIWLKCELSSNLTNQQKLVLVASLYLIGPVILWGLCLVKGSSLSNYGLIVDWSLLSGWIEGLGLGVIGIFLLVTVQVLGGWISISREVLSFQLFSVVGSIFLVAVGIGGVEELIFRGFLTKELSDLDNGLGVMIASGIFATLHLVWERKETLVQLLGLWIMGLVLSLALWVDHGSIGLPWGLHTGWIWMIAVCDTAELISYTESNRIWITGIYHKPLAGILGIGLLLLTGLLLWGVSGTFVL